MTLYDDVAAALGTVEGLAVVDEGDETQTLALPVAYIVYGGHERPTGATLKLKVEVLVIAAWEAELGAQAYTAQLATDVAAAIEAMPNARLLDVSPGAYSPPTDETTTALGIEVTVIAA